MLCPSCRAFISSTPDRCVCGYQRIRQVISLEEYRGNLPLGEPDERNAQALLLGVNSLLGIMKLSSVIMTSGRRTPEHNLLIGGSPKSLHLTAQAIDLADNDRFIGSFLLVNQHYLRERGFAIEDPSYCYRKNQNRWIHIQSVLPPSGKTVFIPYAGEPRIV